MMVTEDMGRTVWLTKHRVSPLLHHPLPTRANWTEMETWILTCSNTTEDSMWQIHDLLQNTEIHICEHLPHPARETVPRWCPGRAGTTGSHSSNHVSTPRCTTAGTMAATAPCMEEAMRQCNLEESKVRIPSRQNCHTTMLEPWWEMDPWDLQVATVSGNFN
jgi:hypothetical protein